MKKKNGFTLVELLAVIVILAIILVIAVPKITTTINDARRGAYESTLKMIKKSAETYWLTKQTLGENNPTWSLTEAKCTDVTDLSADYDLTNCAVTFSNDGKASVNTGYVSTGKFAYCVGTIDGTGNMTISTATNAGAGNTCKIAS